MVQEGTSLRHRALAVFRTTHEALRAEKVVRAAGIPCRVQLRPRAISTDCGLAMYVPVQDLRRLMEVCRREGLDAGFHVWEEGRGWKRIDGG